MTSSFIRASLLGAFTVVVPMANVLPDAGTHTSEMEPLLSMAVAV